MDDCSNFEQGSQPKSVEVFQPARFPVDLGLPNAEEHLLKESAAAVRKEFRSSAKLRRLRCERVSIFSERGRGAVGVLQVNKLLEFDWTWEGATAFRPVALDGDVAITNEDAENFLYGAENSWRGEVLEVDEQNGCLFISLDNPEALPTVGDFFIQPFEFLNTLDAVFNDRAFIEAQQVLPCRLKSAEGGVHPVLTVAHPATASMPELSDWWRHSWSVLWGPPGTGKSWRTGQQIAAALADPTERILLISTTNKATDTVAIYTGKACREHCPDILQSNKLLRIGKGADLTLFQRECLDSMLCGTESAVLQEIRRISEALQKEPELEERALLRKRLVAQQAISDRGSRLFIDPEIRGIVATAFKATLLLRNSEVAAMIAHGEAPFTTIFIDEAGLISRAAIAALSLLAARRVVLVGDSKQLAPISRASRILPTRHQRWLAKSGLSHLDELADTPVAVHVLREQRRMHSDICEVVSRYQYRGALTTADQTKALVSTAPPFLTEFSRVIWYVLDEEADDLESIRAERGPGNKSFVRRITLNILEKLFSEPRFRDTKGLFISPYRAQAQAVAQWIAAREITGWRASTVHSQQGGEEDIVVFDTVYANNTAWPIEEWQRLINVGLSRAKEAVILLASRSEMDEPYLRGLKAMLRPGSVKLVQDVPTWVPVSSEPTKSKGAAGYLGESSTQYKTNSMGRQIADRKKMSPILSREQQRLTNLQLDGRPRLVRGVAGSGKSIVLSAWVAKTVERLEIDSNATIWAVFANRSLHKLLQHSIESAWNELSAGSLFQPRDFPWHKVRLLHIREVLSEILPRSTMSAEDFEFDYDRAAEEYLNKYNAGRQLPVCTALFIDEAQDMGPSTLKLLLSLVAQTNQDDPNSRPAHIFYDNAQNVYGRKNPKWSEFGLDMRGRSTILKESFRSTRAITELAVNVQSRLDKEANSVDLKELCELQLVAVGQRQREEWLEVNFSQVDGPSPIFQVLPTRQAEMARIASHLHDLVLKEEIPAKEITLLFVGKQTESLLLAALAPLLRPIGVELSIQKREAFERRENTLLATTPHSYKGYESEVVIIPGVNQFVAEGGEILVSPLYVAMTRARSLLAMYGTNNPSEQSLRIASTISRCLELLNNGAVTGD